MHVGGSRRLASVIVAALVAAGLATVSGPVAPVGAASPEAAEAAPTPTPPRVGAPSSIAVIGDSISTATGTANLGSETPANSWVTGTNSSVISMRQRLGISTANAYTLAQNGKRMADFDDQANVMPAANQYAVLELGGNDLCRPSTAEMTSVASYRAQFRAGLAALRARNPNTLLFVASIPDIYNLWFLRGAPESVNPYVNEDPDQAGRARLYWDNGLIDVIPCKSLLENPTSTSAADEARRQVVRDRNKAFNQVLAEECARDLRCRFDDFAFFDKTSNRVSPPDGALLPRAQWFFVNKDISHDRGFWSWLCPAPGILEGGTVCGDHFHPSLEGQAKLAQGGHEESFDFTDTVVPVVNATPDRAPDGPGVYADDVIVTFAGNDNVGLRGQEVRVHHPNGNVDGWFPYTGVAGPLRVDEVGTSHVEVRSIDVNGNQSASKILSIIIDPTQFGEIDGTVTGPDGPVGGVQVGVHLPGAEGALVATTTAPDGSYTFDPVVVGDYKVGFLDPSGVHLPEWFDDAPNHAQADDVSVADGTTTVDAQLALTPGAIEGTVTDEQGEPVDGVTVRATPSGENGEAGSAVTGGDGAYEIDGLTPGGHDVEFEGLECVLAGEWFDDHPDRASADEVVVPTAGGAATADASLAEAEPGPHGLSDVPSWVDTAVRWVVDDCNDPPYMTGFDDDTFRPDTDLSRGQAVRALHRIAGSPDPTGWAHGLSDVPSWVQAPVAWAVHHEFMTGFDDGTFGPGRSISRAQLVRVLYRLAGSPDPETFPAHGFVDVPNWVEPAVRWAKANGVVNGFGNEFRPDLPINRAQFANSAFHQNTP